MERSLVAVLAGTFTLRFSTGLTGAMLAAYLAKLPEHGGQEVAASTLALLHASFYLAELCLSPLFGVISDRLGHHRVMLFGPAFGAVAVVLTALTTNLVILGGTRLLEGASTAASVPSILGYIALATAGREPPPAPGAARCPPWPRPPARQWPPPEAPQERHEPRRVAQEGADWQDHVGGRGGPEGRLQERQQDI